MSRLLYNTAIVNKLAELVKNNPDWRFGQIIFNSGVINSSSTDSDGKPIIDDPFYEESRSTWNRMCDNKICFKDEQLS